MRHRYSLRHVHFLPKPVLAQISVIPQRMWHCFHFCYGRKFPGVPSDIFLPYYPHKLGEGANAWIWAIALIRREGHVPLSLCLSLHVRTPRKGHAITQLEGRLLSVGEGQEFSPDIKSAGTLTLGSSLQNYKKFLLSCSVYGTLLYYTKVKRVFHFFLLLNNIPLDRL